MTIMSYVALSAILASFVYFGSKLVTGRKRGRYRPRHSLMERAEAGPGEVEVAQTHAEPGELPVRCNHPAEISVDTLPDLATEELAHAAHGMRALVTHMYHELQLRHYRDEGIDDVEQFLQEHGGRS